MWEDTSQALRSFDFAQDKLWGCGPAPAYVLSFRAQRGISTRMSPEGDPEQSEG